MTDPRILPLEGVENFRDYGGYAVGGGRVASGQLFRAAHQARATPADLQIMAALKLATLVDLRRPRERDNDPSLRHEGFAAQVIQCDLGDHAEAPHVAFLRETDLTPESARAFFLDYYDKAPFEPRHLELFGRYFAALAAGDGPVLIHCTAGKDRTGVLVAMIMDVVGASPEDIAHEYGLSDLAIDRLIAYLRSNNRELQGTDAEIRARMATPPEKIAGFMELLHAKYGSSEDFFRSMGVSEATFDGVRSILTV